MPEDLNPKERSQRARLAAHVLHSRYDSRDLTRPARKSFDKRFEEEVDPDHLLSNEERARRANHAKKAYFQRLALMSVQARRQRRAK